jgi:hypothetical protein
VAKTPAPQAAPTAIAPVGLVPPVTSLAPPAPAVSLGASVGVPCLPGAEEGSPGWCPPSPPNPPTVTPPSVPDSPLGPLPAPLGSSLDPLHQGQRDALPYVDQPDAAAPVWWDDSNFFDTGHTGENRGDVYVTVGSNRVFVAARDGLNSYDATTLAHLQTIQGPEEFPGGLAFYGDEVYFATRWSKDVGSYIDVYDLDGRLRREIRDPLAALNNSYSATWSWEGGGQDPPTDIHITGLAVANHEILATTNQLPSGPLEGFSLVEILDSATGALKGVVLQPPRLQCGAQGGARCDQPSCLIDDGQCNVPGKPSVVSSRWRDIATTPDIDATWVDYGPIRRGLFIPAAALPDFLSRTPNIDVLALLQGVSAWCVPSPCAEPMDTRGTFGVPGMRWLQVTDGDGQTIREYSVYKDGGATDRVGHDLKRTWSARPYQTTPPGAQDVAYNNRELRIDWRGSLTRPAWLKGTKCLDYLVSDADIYVAGYFGQRWYEPARNFGRIDFKVDGQVIDSLTQPIGTYCLDTHRVPNGVRNLTAVAYANGNTATKTNPTLRVDNENPAGRVDAPKKFITGTLNVTGQISDGFSGPRDWQLRAQRDGDGRRNLCAAQPPSTLEECSWNTQDGQSPDGWYTLDAHMRDLTVDDGPNETDTAGVRTYVDNTPPSLSLSGALIDRANGDTNVLDGDRPGMHIDVQDVGSGAQHAEVQVDGSVVDSLNQACPDGGCSLGRDFTFDGSGQSEGAHQITVVATDQLGHRADQSFWITVVRDSDRDGVSDRDDLCPSVAASGPDGCPGWSTGQGVDDPGPWDGTDDPPDDATDPDGEAMLNNPDGTSVNATAPDATSTAASTVEDLGYGTSVPAIGGTGNADADTAAATARQTLLALDQTASKTGGDALQGTDGSVTADVGGPNGPPAACPRNRTWAPTRFESVKIKYQRSGHDRNGHAYYQYYLHYQLMSYLWPYAERTYMKVSTINPDGRPGRHGNDSDARRNRGDAWKPYYAHTTIRVSPHSDIVYVMHADVKNAPIGRNEFLEGTNFHGACQAILNP